MELPKTAMIHNVFHVSRLKQYRQDFKLHPVIFPTQFIEGQPLIKPIKILEERTRLQTDKPITEVLVQWDGMLTKNAS